MSEEKQDLISRGEQIIKQVRGVISARIVTDANENIEEIHVLASHERAPKQIVRDIESALVVQLGISVDHKKISVAQVEEEEEFNVPAGLRPRLVSINLLTAGVTAEARVEISVGDKIYEGTAAGPNTVNNRLRLVAAATLNAIENYLEEGSRFVVEDLVKLPFARKEAIVVAVSLVTGRGEESLIGAAFVQHDDREATGKATLGAVNRRLSILFRDKEN